MIGSYCPRCGTNHKHQVIAYCFPMSLCTRCGTVSGFFAFFYLLCSLPEVFFNEGIDTTYFMGYEGNYWSALVLYMGDLINGRTADDRREITGEASGSGENEGR